MKDNPSFEEEIVLEFKRTFAEISDSSGERIRDEVLFGRSSDLMGPLQKS